MYKSFCNLCFYYLKGKIDKRKFLEKLLLFCDLDKVSYIPIDSSCFTDYSIRITGANYPSVEIFDRENNQYIFEVYEGFDLCGNDLYLMMKTVFANEMEIESTYQLNEGVFICKKLFIKNGNEQLKFSNETEKNCFSFCDKYAIRYFDNSKDRGIPLFEKSIQYDYNNLSRKSIFSSLSQRKVLYRKEDHLVYHFQNMDIFLLKGLYVTDVKYLQECLSSSCLSFIDCNCGEWGELSTTFLSGIINGKEHMLKILAGFEEYMYRVEYSIAGNISFKKGVMDLFPFLEELLQDPFIEVCYLNLVSMRDILKKGELFNEGVLSPKSYVNEKERYFEYIIAQDQIFNLAKSELEDIQIKEKQFIKRDENRGA